MTVSGHVGRLAAGGAHFFTLLTQVAEVHQELRLQGSERDGTVSASWFEGRSVREAGKRLRMSLRDARLPAMIALALGDDRAP